MKRSLILVTLAVFGLSVGAVIERCQSSPVSTQGLVSLPYPDLPDAVLTPGAVRTTDLAAITNTRTGTIRNVPQSEKDAVYREYGLDPRHHQSCEVDHLVSLELGGSNDIKNLWTEHYSEPWGARDKDRLENHLHALIAVGAVPVAEAQHAIATNWIAAYKKYMPISSDHA